MMQWYRSKIDLWIAALLCMPPIASIGACVALAVDGKFAELPWGVVAIVIVFAIYVGLVFPMKYGLDDSQLIIRFGICRQRIQLADVLEVHPTHNPLSAPALSLDRLHVQFGHSPLRFVLISPVDRDHFLEEFAQRSGLKHERDRLVRS
jgi:hypothetical protein